MKESDERISESGIVNFLINNSYVKILYLTIVSSAFPISVSSKILLLLKKIHFVIFTSTFVCIHDSLTYHIAS